MSSYVTNPHIQFLDEDGHPLAYGTVETYIAGTTTPYTTMKDFKGTMNPTRIVLDDDGSCCMIIPEDQLIKLVIKTSEGRLFRTYDNVGSGGGGASGGDYYGSTFISIDQITRKVSIQNMKRLTSDGTIIFTDKPKELELSINPELIEQPYDLEGGDGISITDIGNKKVISLDESGIVTITSTDLDVTKSGNEYSINATRIYNYINSVLDEFKGEYEGTLNVLNQPQTNKYLYKDLNGTLCWNEVQQGGGGEGGDSLWVNLKGELTSIVPKTHTWTIKGTRVKIQSSMGASGTSLDLQYDSIYNNYYQATVPFITNYPTSQDGKLYMLERNDYDNKYKMVEYVAPDLSTKQDTLVSGTNIKTINGQSLLGEGNITIQGGGGDGYWTLDSESWQLTPNIIAYGSINYEQGTWHNDHFEWLYEPRQGDSNYKQETDCYSSTWQKLAKNTSNVTKEVEVTYEDITLKDNSSGNTLVITADGIYKDEGKTTNILEQITSIADILNQSAKGKYLHQNETTGALEWVDIGALNTAQLTVGEGLTLTYDEATNQYTINLE